MKIIVQPQKGTFKLLFIEGGRAVASGFVDLAGTPKGHRPKNFKIRKRQKQLKPTPTRDLIALLRRSKVQLAGSAQEFESFLNDLQIPYGRIDICRYCQIEDRFTPVNKATGVRYGQEYVCMDCAKRELRRELGYMGKFGGSMLSHLEELLEQIRDLNKVLASVGPDRPDRARTLYDRLEAHERQDTVHITELPLPEGFAKASGVEYLMPVQQLAVESGLLERQHLLVVSATASGKTFIGEMAGMKNFLEGKGKMLFLVPLVALANQKYQRFRDRYGHLVKVSLQTGVSRLNLPETRPVGERDIFAPIVVGTYEGIDHALRTGRTLKDIGTVVIDEVQMLEDPERGHRLDGLIARLKHVAPNAQFLYLSATIGMPGLLAKKLNAHLVRYAERPVPLERHLIFVERTKKIDFIKQMVAEEFKQRSSKGYRGQTIVFTNSRARCHVIADAIGRKAAPYHAGLSSQERRDVEKRFANGDVAAVVTTAALAAGVDFPASQVIFDALAMGIEWLGVGEFHQMMGRAGRPDFHDLGRIVILAEPGGSYSRTSGRTEDEVAVGLLRGEMEEVAPEYDLEESSEEFVANAVVCGGDEQQIIRLNHLMVGTLEPVLSALLDEQLVKRRAGRIELSDMARVMAEHFIGMERLLEIRHLVTKMDDAAQIVAELDCADEKRG
ncbi:DEAD/DEAH box helicase [Methanoculleus sp. FWC-SCC1]|uniref:DEAD/DEAH box helicase n=1 Tax=Methanoculleus frigidifontis TaxID=2584085 RepID=A0ABT8M9C9_9EURY|nr:DEAD/DEAH box helicase [Methanoculleus sp. FWC-SCC1]MDN7024540.1 DEAD/DEAH box helicase [Methanoculleus sp. FWC-SCC1]